MARTPSNMMPIGTIAPDFTLPDTLSGKLIPLSDISHEKKGTVVMFICNHCPFVVHILEELIQVAVQYQKQGIGFVAISSNDVENYPQDHPDKMQILAQEKNFPFPYLYDASQNSAKAYDAACTPDFYVFDAGLKCVYRGRFDEATPGNDKPVNGKDLRTALDQLLAGREISKQQFPSLGCNIKWKV